MALVTEWKDHKIEGSGVWSKYNGDWGIVGAPDMELKKVQVTKRSGDVAYYQLGKRIGQNRYGYVYEVKSRLKSKEDPNGEFATERQKTAIRNMVRKLRKIEQFDSVSENPQEAADRIEKEVSDELTRAKASSLIKTLAFLIDDAM